MRKLLLISLMVLCHQAYSQIYLENASFEGTPQDATVPIGWHPCEAGTTPDILPGFWGVYTEASDGDTFVGVITREDGSWESIGQRLQVPIKSKECYSFKMDLAHSQTYSGYNQPLKVRIWGCQSRCSKDQLIAETKFIKHSDWETYEFQFFAKKDLNYILIEAHYADNSFSYRGNVLIDNIMPFKKCIRASLD
jgi:hypothetical protein